MKKEIKIVILLIIIISSLLIIACNHSNKPAQQPVTPKVNTSTAAKALRDRTNRRIIDTSIPKTIISFKEKTFDFGYIKSGDVVTHNFIISNTGANPLVVYNVQGTCGCTVPHWPSKPVLPGDTGHIAIQYNSNGESGLQNKKMRVFTNTKPMETDIFFKANVKE
jgi:hypothetical protein